MSEALLQIRGLTVAFETERGQKQIVPVQDVSLSIFPGQTVALVGESGSGKSVTALSILRLIPQPPGKTLAGQILFGGRDLCALSERELQQVRGKDIAMIFQEPMTSLNPVYTIGDQIMEAVMLHQKVRPADARIIAEQAMADVGIADPRRRLSAYPHQLSGGMRQRVMIAMALSCRPKLLIADEPTTALDVTIQAQILELLRRLQRETGMAILLITHDLGVVAENADVVAVMYASRIVEYAGVEELFDRPQHPYTLGLFSAVPRLGHAADRLNAIPGTVPNPSAFPGGCKFHPRCALTRSLASHEHNTVQVTVDRRPVAVMRPCAQEEPKLRQVSPRHWAACHFAEGYANSPAGAPTLDHRREVVPETIAVEEAQA
ncbi:MAG: ABC transporter ATP-binding protein [Tepidisphaeraceae bacterium]|jgi:peptide/nickel transport system ATP-binding protein/oligopeptide transport system ATP-binding protein